MTILQNSKAILLTSLLLLAGCGSFLRSDVVTFHEGPMPAGETIKVVPTDPQNAASLEFRSYAGLISEELRKIGYTPVTDPDASADLLAEVDYAVEPGPALVSSDPSARFVRYHFNYGRYYDPFYFGIYDNWAPEVYSTPTYQRSLEMNIVNNDQAHERIFEGRVQSNGTQSTLPELMPYLITAMFKNFPGESGVTKVVTIETDM